MKGTSGPKISLLFVSSGLCLNSCQLTFKICTFLLSIRNMVREIVSVYFNNAVSFAAEGAIPRWHFGGKAASPDGVRHSGCHL